MKIVLAFDIVQVNVILQALDAGPHKDVRQLIDYILNEANAQTRKPEEEVAEQTS
jgi:hypothetical protein